MMNSAEKSRASLFGNPALGALAVRAVALGLSLGLCSLVIGAGWASEETTYPRDPAQAVAIALDDAAKAEDAAAARGADTASFDAQLPDGAGRIAAAANAFGRNVRATYVAYHETLLTMNYYQLLVPVRVDNDPDFARTDRTLERMRAAVETREQRLSAAVTAFRAQIASADIEDGAKCTALARFDRATSSNLASRERETALEENLIDEQKALLADLAVAKGGWTATGPTALVFRDASAMKTYRAHVASLLKIAGALDALIGHAHPEQA
jgi:hypothetical protein